MSALLPLQTFANLPPNWQLPQLDANFAQLNAAIAALTATGTLNLPGSGGVVGTAVLSYTQIGPWVGMRVVADFTDPGVNQGLITLSGLPPTLTPTLGMTVYGGQLIATGQNGLLGGVTIGANSVITIGPMVSITVPSGAVALFGPNPFGASGLTHGLPQGFSFSYAVF
jgi:hypothetical protein